MLRRNEIFLDIGKHAILSLVAFGGAIFLLIDNTEAHKYWALAFAFQSGLYFAAACMDIGKWRNEIVSEKPKTFKYVYPPEHSSKSFVENVLKEHAKLNE